MANEVIKMDSKLRTKLFWRYTFLASCCFSQVKMMTVGFCVALLPWFKKLYPEYIDYIAAGFRKVALNADQLLDKKAEKKSEGRWYGTENE